MVHGFTTKKIKQKDSLGQRFRLARKAKKVTLLEAETATKVRAKFLDAIEKSKWSNLPQSVYTRGFVLAYAKFLDFPANEALEAFNYETKLFAPSNSDISYKQNFKEKKVLVTPKIIAFSSLAVFIIFLLSYVVIQLFNFAGTPNLEIVSPSNNTVVESEAVDLNGLTDTDTKILVNNEIVPVSSDGKFSIKLKLRRGINTLKVVALNKAKKETSEIFTVEYKPKTAEAVAASINQ